MEPRELLDKYSDNLLGIELLSAEKEKLKESVITLEIKQMLAEIDVEFNQKTAPLTLENEHLMAQVKSSVIEKGETLTGSWHQAVFMRGRISWDSKGLAGFSVAHPEIQVFQHVGDPSVSVKSRKEAK